MDPSVKQQFERLAKGPNANETMHIYTASIFSNSITSAYAKIKAYYDTHYSMTDQGLIFSPFSSSLMPETVVHLLEYNIADAREHLADEYTSVAYLIANMEAGHDPNASADKLNTIKQGLSLIEHSLDFLDAIITMMPKAQSTAA